MPNACVNKVVYGTTVLVDLTGTTATADKIQTGYGAYGKDGAWMSGSYVPPSAMTASEIQTAVNAGWT